MSNISHDSSQGRRIEVIGLDLPLLRVRLITRIVSTHNQICDILQLYSKSLCFLCKPDRIMTECGHLKFVRSAAKAYKEHAALYESV